MYLHGIAMFPLRTLEGVGALRATVLVGAQRTLAPNGATPTDNNHPTPTVRSALKPLTQKYRSAAARDSRSGQSPHDESTRSFLFLNSRGLDLSKQQ